MERRIEACLKHDQEKKFTLKTRKEFSLRLSKGKGRNTSHEGYMGGLTRFLQHKVPMSISTSSGSPVQGNHSSRQYVTGYPFIQLGEERQGRCLRK